MRLTPALRGVLAGAVLVAAGFAIAFAPPGPADWGARLVALGLAILLPCTMALGAPKAGPRARVVPWALWGTGLVLAGAFGAALLLPATEGPGVALYGGFPLRAATLLYGAGVLPLVLLPLLYAWTFPAEPAVGARPPATEGDRGAPPEGGA